MNAQMQLVEEAAKLYFEPLFKKQNKIIDETTFFHKKDGDQLGRRMRIKYRLADDGTQHQIIYHIKTHQHGSTSRGSSTKPVDAKELFIYKVFEYMGFGPKVHFFFNSLSRGGFYIATQDASFSKKPAINKSFKTYQEMVEENKLSSNEETYINLSSLDILSRIFNVRDLTTNPSNFGSAEVDKGRLKWQILDFRIENYDQHILPGIFEGFIAGNGMYNYHGFLGQVLRERPLIERTQTAKQVIELLETGHVRYSHDGSRKLS